MMRTTFVVALLAATVLAGCNRKPPKGEQPETGPAPTPPATALTAEADDGQWLMAAKDYANTRFSGLTEITPANVANLKLAWSFSTGVLRGQEAAPLVVNNTMYVVTPYPNIALRARPDASPARR